MFCHAGRVGSAFAAELGTMAVSEQTDSLRVLGSDPVDYLITPRVAACMVATPVLNLLCFCMGTPLGPSSFRRCDSWNVSWHWQHEKSSREIFHHTTHSSMWQGC